MLSNGAESNYDRHAPFVNYRRLHNAKVMDRKHVQDNAYTIYIVYMYSTVGTSQWYRTLGRLTPVKFMDNE